jgi:hypothetical protein
LWYYASPGNVDSGKSKATSAHCASKVRFTLLECYILNGQRTLTSSSLDSLSTTHSGRGLTPTVKYVGRGIVIFSARRSATASSSSLKRSPVTIAKEKLFLVCKVESFVKTDLSWPLTSPRTILFRSYQLKP